MSFPRRSRGNRGQSQENYRRDQNQHTYGAGFQPPVHINGNYHRDSDFTSFDKSANAEKIIYLQREWDRIDEYRRSNPGKVEYYVEKTATSESMSFEPFDLEGFLNERTRNKTS